MSMSTTTRPGPTSATGRDGLRLVPGAAAVYVTAWIVGLAVPTSPLSAEPTAAEAFARYTDTALRIALQATLVHAVAGLALGVLSWGLASVAAGRLRTTVLVAGVGAATVSLAQAALALVAVLTARGQDGSWSLTVLTTINRADAVKLVLLAVLALGVTVALRRAGTLPLWLGVLGAVLAVSLLLGAASFVTALPLLDAALVVSLLLLLAWVGALGVRVSRQRRVHTLEVRP